jgi:hypothetical protein
MTSKSTKKTSRDCEQMVEFEGGQNAFDFTTEIQQLD